MKASSPQNSQARRTLRWSKGTLGNLPIRVRLTMLYVLLLALILVGFSGVLYLLLDQGLDTQIDDNLRASADQASGAVSVEGGQLSVPLVEGESDLSALGESGLLARVITLDGNVVQSVGPFHTLPVDSATLLSARQGQSLYSSVATPGDGTPIRLYTVPFQENGIGPVYGVVQVGQSLQPAQDTLRQLLVILALVIPLTLAFAIAAGIFLANRALSPIDRITRAAQGISAQSLGRRLDLSLPDDEVGRLARTFDTMLDRLDSAFRRQRQFTADASHELRTPLAIMKGNIGVALNRPRRSAEYLQVLRDLEEEVDRLTRLVEDLLLLARSEGDRPLLHVEKVDLAEMLAVVTERLHPLAEAKRQTVSLQVPQVACLQGDADKLLRLFMNLVENAIKFTPEGGRITVTATDGEPDWLVVEVADDGPGIPIEELGQVFDRFYRVDTARSRASGGSGLGLALARWIAEAHEGRIQARRGAVQGTVFSVRLPKAARHLHATFTPPSRHLHATL